MSGTGILNNELYVGQLVWNRLTYLKDPKTGRRRSRLNAPKLWILHEVPALRIVDNDIWDAVKARQTAIRESGRVVSARATRFWERRRSRHLLTGLVQCGECGSQYASIGRDYLACSSARGRGTCSNRQSIRRHALEGMIHEGIRQRLMAPAGSAASRKWRAGVERIFWSSHGASLRITRLWLGEAEGLDPAGLEPELGDGIGLCTSNPPPSKSGPSLPEEGGTAARCPKRS